MTRPLLMLKTKRRALTQKEAAQDLNTIIERRFLAGECTACAKPVPVRGYAICDECWKTAPRKFKRDILWAESGMTAKARSGIEKPRNLWFKLMRWNLRRVGTITGRELLAAPRNYKAPSANAAGP